VGGEPGFAVVQIVDGYLVLGLLMFELEPSLCPFDRYGSWASRPSMDAGAAALIVHSYQSVIGKELLKPFGHPDIRGRR